MDLKVSDDKSIESLLNKAVELKVHPVEAIIAFAAWLDWNIATPDQKDDESVSGLGIGTQGYIDELFTNGCSDEKD